MAVTTLDIVDILYHRLRDAGLGLTGAIYKNNDRPANSEKEDIVINSLPVNNSSLQQAVANVNIHPVLEARNVNNVVSYSFNWTRLNQLVKTVKPVLEQAKTDMWTAGYHYEIQQDGLIPDENFYNIRINFYSLNISN
jgi:hypothetical protein